MRKVVASGRRLSTRSIARTGCGFLILVFLLTWVIPSVELVLALRFVAAVIATVSTAVALAWYEKSRDLRAEVVGLIVITSGVTMSLSAWTWFSDLFGVFSGTVIVMGVLGFFTHLLADCVFAGLREFAAFPRCEQCGYDLSGAPDRACPECGSAQHRAAVPPDGSV